MALPNGTNTRNALVMLAPYADAYALCNLHLNRPETCNEIYYDNEGRLTQDNLTRTRRL